jgi:hypothetical protein
MIKELEALKVLKSNAILFDDGTDFGASMLEAISDLEKALTPPTQEEMKKYIDENFELLLHYPLSFSEHNGKYYMMAHYERIEISLELVVALIKNVGTIQDYILQQEKVEAKGENNER